MQPDIAHHLGAVTRIVRREERDGRTADVLVAQRTYDTTPDDLWDALTTAERIPRWFLPVTGDLRVGGRYQLEGNAGGEVLGCDPPRHLSITWEYGGDVSWVDVRLEPDPDGGTRLELEHAAFPPPDLPFGPGAVGIGWEMALLGLGEHLAGAPPVDQEESMAWQTSDDAKRMMRASADGWAEADAAGGTPEA